MHINIFRTLKIEMYGLLTMNTYNNGSTKKELSRILPRSAQNAIRKCPEMNGTWMHINYTQDGTSQPSNIFIVLNEDRTVGTVFAKENKYEGVAYALTNFKDKNGWTLNTENEIQSPTVINKLAESVEQESVIEAMAKEIEALKLRVLLAEKRADEAEARAAKHYSLKITAQNIAKNMARSNAVQTPDEFDAELDDMVTDNFVPSEEELNNEAETVEPVKTETKSVEPKTITRAALDKMYITNDERLDKIWELIDAGTIQIDENA